MHTTGTVQLACIDCHGGNGDVMRPAGSDMRAYERAKHEAHPKPGIPRMPIHPRIRCERTRIG